MMLWEHNFPYIRCHGVMLRRSISYMGDNRSLTPNIGRRCNNNQIKIVQKQRLQPPCFVVKYITYRVAADMSKEIIGNLFVVELELLEKCYRGMNDNDMSSFESGVA
uniref:Uncharacterized protein n=1 Tax=Megaselia scalaris TaxID=36166 RepID=T1GYB9_MEGSC